MIKRMVLGLLVCMSLGLNAYYMWESYRPSRLLGIYELRDCADKIDWYVVVFEDGALVAHKGMLPQMPALESLVTRAPKVILAPTEGICRSRSI